MRANLIHLLGVLALITGILVGVFLNRSDEVRIIFDTDSPLQSVEFLSVAEFEGVIGYKMLFSFRIDSATDEKLTLAFNVIEGEPLPADADNYQSNYFLPSLTEISRFGFSARRWISWDRMSVSERKWWVEKMQLTESIWMFIEGENREEPPRRQVFLMSSTGQVNEPL